MDAIELFVKVVMRACEETGRSVPEVELRSQIDFEAVRAAFGAPFVMVDDELLYPGPVEQAAILASRIIELVPLPHQIERAAALLFADIRLQQAGYELVAPATEIEAVFVAISEDRVSDDALIRWFARRIRPLRALL